VQLLDAAKQDAQITEQVDRAEYTLLREWLVQNVHQYGRSRLPAEIVQAATGRPLGADAYVKYLEEKYSDIYGLS